MYLSTVSEINNALKHKRVESEADRELIYIHGMVLISFYNNEYMNHYMILMRELLAEKCADEK